MFKTYKALMKYFLLLTVGKYDGVAIDGKVSMIDLGKPGTGICVPPASTMYTPGFKSGARVNSNSWGSGYNGAGYYDSQDTDKYLYKNPVWFQRTVLSLHCFVE
jgi:hypothetical protein